MGCNISGIRVPLTDSNTYSCCIVKVISLEGWTDVMYIIQDTHSFYNFIYFVVLIIVSLVFKNYKSYFFIF